MPDIFDEFMDELRRRQAGGRGPRGPRRVGPEDPGSEDPGPDDQDPVEPPPSEPGRDGPGRDQPPRRQEPRRVRPASQGPRLRTWAVVAIAALLVLLFTTGIELWTNVIWFQSVGFDSVYWTRLSAGGGLFLAGLVLTLLVLLGNLQLAGRLAPPPPPGATGSGALRDFLGRLNEAAQSAGQSPYGGPGRVYRTGREPAAFEVPMPDLSPVLSWLIGGIAVLVALAVAGALAASWETILLWLNRVPFATDGSTAVIDPVFTRDISWFLFELPFLRLIQGIVNWLLIGSLLVVGARYLLAAGRGADVLATPTRVHLAVLGGLLLLSTAFGYQLDKYELAYSSAGVAAGVSYTDANARFFAYDLLTVLSGLAAAFLIGGAFTRWLWPLGATVVVWFLASFVVGRIYPEAIQRLVVEPNKLAQEERFIGNNIAMTRLAFGLSGWEERPYSGAAPLAREQIDQEQATFQNARLWDYRPLGNTLDQLQTVRRYYRFNDVDTDRYMIDGAMRQVMLSARELDLARNPLARGWVNERIIYTHGIGLAMVPVNEVTLEGQPQLFIRNLPPVSAKGVPEVTEPRIYFGEITDTYVVVGARQAEFDYPRGGEASSGGNDVVVENRWSGTTGIRLDTTLMRLLFSARFRDLDLLISDQVTNSSQLLYNRSFQQRLDLIAPFLRYDKDPYVVIDSRGRLVYIRDAFTISDRFPHAQPTNAPEGSGIGGDNFNYIRNSVKVVMDAYDGSMSFYVADPSDPLIRAWQGIFPGLFKPLDQMPDDLVAHLRVPEDLFNVQTSVYGRYHVTQPQTFFDSSDLWTVPSSRTDTASLPSEAYYVIMRMPGEPEPEFLLLQPMVPINRPNMIAWVAARNDQPNYGSTRVYRFPSDTTIFGPAQIEARIDQDPVISAQVTLWSQAGSNVIRGNLIVVPVGESLIYLQPVYLQSTASAFPEFQRIVVASPTTVVWGRTLGEALELLLRGGSGPTPTPTPTPGPGASPTPTGTPGPTRSPGPDGLPTDVPGLIEYANQHFELAQQALRAGDFARYGTEIELVREALQRLDSLSGASPGPAAGLSP
jgi:uncharacterized membrane protein (UPF0182 family)